ncbi:Zn-dependent peptidase ImmA (M78 family) [Flavobacterium sp. 28YEA47A]|uniref:helix-turn-helix domain-containing protein n=1 Tax=Flavobacterium sp. 28YEA47A TaxID=3156276 RepID=UPI0035188F5A
MNHRQLTFAREIRGYSQTDLSSSIKGLSQSNLSKFEKGLSVLSEEIQSKIIEFLNFPVEFFDRKINTSIENGNYRKKANITKSDILKFENKCKILGYIIDEMAQSLNWPEFKLVPLNVEDGYSPEYVANYNRKILKLQKDEPVKNICSILENSGIIIYEMDAYDKFDGISFFTEQGYAVIVINKSFSNDRKRFTIAHELGHILLHNESNFPVSEFRDEKIKEKEANSFASEFLMPANEIKNSLRGITLGDIGRLKSYWLTSMGSIIIKAKNLNCITEDKYKYFMIEMSRNGFNKKEPVEVFIDKPQCFKNGYFLFKNDLSYNEDDFINSMNLPKDILDDIFYFDKMVMLKVFRN